MARQIKFKDLGDDVVCAGIELDDGNVICACCGGIFEKDEEGVTWEKLDTFENLIDLTDEILGGDADGAKGA